MTDANTPKIPHVDKLIKSMIAMNVIYTVSAAIKKFIIDCYYITDIVKVNGCRITKQYVYFVKYETF